MMVGCKCEIRRERERKRQRQRQRERKKNHVIANLVVSLKLDNLY